MVAAQRLFSDTPSVTSVCTGDSSLKEGAEAALLVGHSRGDSSRRKDTGPSGRGRLPPHWVRNGRPAFRAKQQFIFLAVTGKKYAGLRPHIFAS